MEIPFRMLEKMMMANAGRMHKTREKIVPRKNMRGPNSFLSIRLEAANSTTHPSVYPVFAPSAKAIMGRPLSKNESTLMPLIRENW